MDRSVAARKTAAAAATSDRSSETQPRGGRQLIRHARERRLTPDALIAHRQREQKRQTRRDDDAVAADEPGDALQVADSWLLQVQRGLAQRLDAAECRQHESQRRRQRQRPGRKRLQRNERLRREQRPRPSRRGPGRAARRPTPRSPARTVRSTGRSSLTLQPPHDADRRQRERHRPAVADEARRRDADDAPAEGDQVVAGHDRGQRAEHQPIDEERRGRNGRQALAECLADAAVQTAAHKERAGLEISRAHDDAEEHDRQHGPGARGSERLPRRSPPMKNAAQPSSARARAVARHTGTYDTSVLVARMTRTRCDAGSLAMAFLWSPILSAEGLVHQPGSRWRASRRAEWPVTTPSSRAAASSVPDDG